MSDIKIKYRYTNFNLSFYLPKDLINIVLDYIYKPDITKLNQEYKLLYGEYYYNGSTEVRFKICFSFNFRSGGWKYHDICSIYGRDLVPLPKNYWYTSKCEQI